LVAAGSEAVTSSDKFASADLKRIGSIPQSLRLVWQAGPSLMVMSVVGGLLQAAFPPLILLLLKKIFDAVGRGGSGNAGHLLWLVLAAGALAILEAVVRAAAGFIADSQGQRVSDHINTLLVAKSVALDVLHFESPQYHDLLYRVREEAPRHAIHLAASFVQLVRSAATLLGLLILLLAFHWIVVALLLAALIPAIAVRAFYARELHELHLRGTALERAADYRRALLSTGEPVKEIRLFDLGDLFRQQFISIRGVLRRERLNIARRRSQIEIITQVGAEFAVFGALGFLALDAARGALSIGSLVVYFWGLQFARSLLNEALGSLVSIYEDHLFLGAVREFQALQSQVTDPVLPAEVPRPIRSGLSIENVSFVYPGAEIPALQDVTIEVRAGETIALVGENGSGKSTLVKLICRLCDPTEGDIRLDGISLKRFRSGELRREMSVVFQDFVRYALSARQNIWLGNIEQPEASIAVEGAARKAGVHEAIARLPHGYATLLGKQFEGGSELSPGEWQKIALARALIRNSQIVILDEPTSALDAQTEFEIFQQFAKLIEGRTAILISHRLSTVRMADQIYVLDQGRVVESGTHDELMARHQNYARLFEIQARPYR